MANFKNFPLLHSRENRRCRLSDNFRATEVCTQHKGIPILMIAVDISLNLHNFSKSEPILIIFTSLDSAPSKTSRGKFLDQNSIVFPCFWKWRKSFGAKNSKDLNSKFDASKKLLQNASYVSTKFSGKKAAFFSILLSQTIFWRQVIAFFM